MGEIIRNLDWSVLTDILLSIVPSLICITFHEYSHGLTAYWMGDTTAKDCGRLSLNPLKHLDFSGIVMMAVFHFGWAKPVPINMRRFKNPKMGMAISALAGPVSNVLLSLIVLFAYGFLFGTVREQSFWSGSFGNIIAVTLYNTAFISTSFAVFNFIPIPPLDGSKVLFSVISDEAYYKLMRYERYGMVILAVIILTGIIDGPLNKAVMWLFEKLFTAADAGFRLGSLFIR